MINRVKEKIADLIGLSNNATGLSDRNLSAAVSSLISGFGATDCVGGSHISANANLPMLKSSYEALLTADDGYVVDDDTVVVLMNGVDITSTSYASGRIFVEELTGDLSITANARTLNQYSVTNNLTLCSSSNSETSVMETSTYTAIISANSGHKIGSIIILMGGVDITSDVYLDGTVSIPRVTGDIVITAIAEEYSLCVVSYVPVGVTLTNQPETIMGGETLSTTIAVTDDISTWWSLYDDGISILMNGEDITASVCTISDDQKTATVNIQNVTGDISICVGLRVDEDAIIYKNRISFFGGSTGISFYLSGDSTQVLIGVKNRSSSDYLAYDSSSTDIAYIPMPTGASEVSFNYAELSADYYEYSYIVLLHGSKNTLDYTMVQGFSTTINTTDPNDENYWDNMAIYYTEGSTAPSEIIITCS